MKKQKKLIPDVDGPKFGIPFRIVGFQALNEKNNYTELLETEKKDWVTLKNRREYINWKQAFSTMICNAFNKTIKTKLEKVVSIKVEYLCEKEDHYI